MLPLVSIVVPAFNSEDVIERCLHSILAQHYTNIEVIVLDDGSTDKTGEIIDSIEEKDSRLIVVHKDNTGVSNTRNLGIELANGSFITFVDSDDYISPEFVSVGVSEIEYRSTIVIQGWGEEDESGARIRDNIFVSSLIYIGNGLSITNLLKSGELNCICGKFFPLDVIKEKKIRFNENINYGEDTLFTIDCLKVSELLIIQENIEYHYVKYNDRKTLSNLQNECVQLIERAKAGNYAILDSIKQYEVAARSSLLIERMCWVYGQVLTGLTMKDRLSISINLLIHDDLFIKCLAFSTMRILRKKIAIVIKRYILSNR